MTNDLTTIAEAAKRLGCTRPKLSAMCSAAKIQKVRIDGRDLIDFADAERVFKDASRTGHVRTQRQGASRDASASVGHGYDALIKHYQIEVTRLQEEVVRVQSQRDALAIRLSGLEDEVLVLQSANRQGASTTEPTTAIAAASATAKPRRWVDRLLNLGR